MLSALSTNSRFYGPELLQIADSVAHEKGLEKEKIIDAMENAIQKAAKSKYGQDHDIQVIIDRRTGEVSIVKCLTAVEEVMNDKIEISLEDAIKQLDENAEIGQVFFTPLPPINFGRLAAYVGRNIIIQKIKEAEREKQYEEFKDKIGEIVSGVVKRAEHNGVTLDIGRTEAVIRKDQLIPKENFRVGERVRAYVVDVSRQEKGPQIFLSRTHSQFLANLFRQEVPEIYDGIIEIKSIARDPGSRSKVAVYTGDHSIDPIGACVGIRGSRVQSIIQELQGEKIDIVLWSDDAATFAVNALAPAEVAKVVMDEENHKFEVLTPDNSLTLAIGRRGQNVRLASMLIGWKITVISESEAIEKNNQEYHMRSQVFMAALDCDELIAHLLVTEGFSEVEEVASVSKEDLSSIDGFDQDLAEELVNRAKAYLENKDQEESEKIKSLNIDEKLLNIALLTKSMMLKLHENNITKIDELGDLSSDELIDLLPELDKESADDIIMKARENWFN